MSEIRTVEDAHRVIAEYDAAHPYWREEGIEARARATERQKRELAESRQAREAEKQASTEKQQVASTDWYAAVDTRVHAHFKDWVWAAIDDRIQQHLDRHGDIFKDAVSEALGMIRKRVQDEFKSADEQLQRALEAKLAVLEERLASNDRILIETTGGPQGQARLREELKRALNELTDAFGGQLAALEQRLRAVPGRLPVAKTYCPDTVHYAGHVVMHQGATYQALRDTARAPPHVDDWICIASAGRDAITPTMRGTFNVYKKYAQLDVVEYDGTSYVARRDNPGIPGEDGWQLVSRSGRRGPAGERGPRGMKGERGARGEEAPTIVSWTLDRTNYRAIPTLSNGAQGAVLELRGLFEQFNDEAVGPAADAAVTMALKDVTRANPGLLAPV